LKILLPDSSHLQEEEADYHSRRGTSMHMLALLLYTARDGLRTGARVTPQDYGTAFEALADVTVSYRRAGHGDGDPRYRDGRRRARCRVLNLRH